MQTRSTLPKLGNGNTIIFGCIVGSRAHGTSLEGSDIDRKWVYVQNPLDVFINGYKPHIQIQKDEVAFELSRFLELCQKANPAMLEMLYVPQDCILHKHPSFDKIIQLRRLFLTKRCKYSYGGIALDQIKKAKEVGKRMYWMEKNIVRKTVLSFCYYLGENLYRGESTRFQSQLLEELFTPNQIETMGLGAIANTENLYNIFWDTRYDFKGIIDPNNSNDVLVSEIPNNAHSIGVLYFDKTSYEKQLKDYAEYETWLKTHNPSNYVEVEGSSEKIDGKALAHAMRLLHTAMDIAEYGELIVRRDNTDYLKAVRAGKYDLSTIIDAATKDYDAMCLAFEHSRLPDVFNDVGQVKLNHFYVRREVIDGIDKTELNCY
jgi:hypothetical protein